MASWYEHIQATGTIPRYPYPVDYDSVNIVDADVLILGGGIAGCHAAINAARAGVKVAIVEKGATVRSGEGGSGVDHWHGALGNPCCKTTPQEWIERARQWNTYDCFITRYIKCRESWPALLDCEKAGVQIRDVNDEFKGADFRDDETKLMFCYDYENKHTMRVCGHDMKPKLYAYAKKLGVKIYDRIQATSLLTEGGRQGARVIGATGVNNRTGEFYIFRSKASIITMARATRVWLCETELAGSEAYMEAPTNTGDGFAMGWRAGAELTNMTGNAPFPVNPFHYISYGVGNADNTWFGCRLRDANGKQIPYVDTNGKVVEDNKALYRPVEGQGFLASSAMLGMPDEKNWWPHLPSDMREMVADGRIKLPMWADLPGMIPSERRALFGLMVGNEGKTRIPVYEKYTKAGFDPDKDMLMCPVLPMENYGEFGSYWEGHTMSHVTTVEMAGFLVDWHLKTSLDGLYAAGWSVFGHGNHSNAAATGRYAGRSAAAFAKTVGTTEIDSKQVERERERVYAFTKKRGHGYGWKEINSGIARIMQDFAGPERQEDSLKMGLHVLGDFQRSEFDEAYAANPHELGCMLECTSVATIGEVILNASLARKASSYELGFFRTDFPEFDPEEWQVLLPIRDVNGEATVRKLSVDYYKENGYEESFEDNYRKYCGLKEDEINE